LVVKWQQAYNVDDLDVLDEILHPGWKTNNWLDGIPQTVEWAKRVHGIVRAIFPDLHYVTEVLTSDGVWVTQRYVGRGTHRGEYAGLHATGRRVEWGGVNLLRVVDGRIVEHWGYADDVGILHQLGAELRPEWLGLRHR
jgi:predicted ester cyclase